MKKAKKNEKRKPVKRRKIFYFIWVLGFFMHPESTGFSYEATIGQNGGQFEPVSIASVESAAQYKL